MRNSGKWLLSAAVFMVAAAPVAQAADYFGPAPLSARSFEPYSEVRAGVLYHDMMQRESGVDINAEIISRWGGLAFKTPFLETMTQLRPHVGANVNTSGDTSMVYAGYTLTVDLTETLFIEGTFGGMAHNGNTEVGTPGRLSLGCNVMFRESAALGLRFSDAFNVSAMIEHSSNAGFCSANNGLTNIGVRLGYAF